MSKRAQRTNRICFQCLLLLCTLFLVFSSLGQAKTVLTIAGHSFTKTATEKGINEYMALHPDVEIQYINVATDKFDGVNKLLTMNVGDLMPDIIHSYLSVSPEILASSMVQPVPTHMAEEIKNFFLPPLIPAVTYKGQIYGIPTENQTYTLGYNQRFFDQAGVATVPQNWDELKAISRKLTITGGDGKISQNGFSIQADAIRFSQSFISLLWSNGGTYLDNSGLPHLNESPATELIQYLADLFPTGQLSFTNNLRNNKAAMSMMPTYWRNVLMDPKLGEYNNIRSTFIPNNKGPKTTYQYGWAFFVSSKSPNAALAWDFLHFMTMEKSENGLTRMSDPLVGIGALPSNKLDVMRQEYRTDLFFKGFIDSFGVARPEPLIPQVSQRQSVLWTTLRPVIEGKVSINQGVADVQQKITNIVNSLTQ